MSDEKRTCGGTGQITYHRDDPRGPEFNMAADSTAGGGYYQCPGCPDCRPTHDDAESEAGRVEMFRGEICECGAGPFIPTTRHKPDCPRETYPEIELVPLTALSHERQLREEAERERDAERYMANMNAEHAREERARAETAECQLHEARQERDGSVAALQQKAEEEFKRANAVSRELERCQEALDLIKADSIVANHEPPRILSRQLEIIQKRCREARSKPNTSPPEEAA